MLRLTRIASTLLLLGAICLPALADTLTRAAAGATRIRVDLPAELQVRPGDVEQVVVTADAAVLAKIDIVQKGDTLVLASKGSFKTERPVQIMVTLKALRALDNAGSGNSTAEGFAGGDLDASLSGSGKVTLKNITGGRIALALGGSGDIAASGSSKTLVVRIEGSGTIDALRMPTRAADASIGGSGTIKVHADETLKAAISGAGNIEYAGKAKVSKSIGGAGSIDPI